MGGLLLMFVIFIQVVSSVELLAELDTRYVQGCQWRHYFAGEGECRRPGMPWPRGATEKFFYMYMCHFSQLHVRLPLDDFTMGVLRALNVAPTQLHPNRWAYLQAFCILCESLYLEPTSYAFLYFYDTRPQKWLLGFL